MRPSLRHATHEPMQIFATARLRNKRKQQRGGIKGDPVVQFSSSIYYAEEGVDEVMALDVMRIGNQNMTSEVCYETEDDSAMEGRSYRSTSGKLVFRPGVSVQSIEIPIINNDLWDTTLEFKCRLKEDGSKHAILGQYLHLARVKIIDNNFFPTDNFKDLDTPRKIAECPKWSLLFGYFSLVANIPGVWRGTIKYVLADIGHNTWDFLFLFLNVYILDYIVDTTSPTSALLLIHERHLSLIACASMFVVSLAWFHALDYARINFPIKGPGRNFIQSALLRKFLNYERVVREHLHAADVTMGIQRDAADLIALGYFNLLAMIKAVTKLGFMLTFKLSAPLLFGAKYDWHTFALLFSIPFTLSIFVYCRQEVTAKALLRRNQAHNDFTNEISLITMNYNLVIDYALRNHCEHSFQKWQMEYTAATKQALQTLENNMYFCKWCTTVFSAMWLIYGGLQVINGNIRVGLFVTNLRLFSAFGGAFLDMYSHTVGMMQTFPALETVTTLMNHRTDVHHRLCLGRERRAHAQAQRKDIFEQIKARNMDVIPIDLMPIVVHFEHPFKFPGKAATLNFKGHVEIHQGQMVAVVGAIGCGKATLLRLIAGSVLPEHSRGSPVFVPSHLRVASVSDEAIFFGGTLYENLTYGMDRSHGHGSRERVKSICKRLTRSNTITDYLDNDDEQAWLDIFSGAHCKLLSVARALVHNVEVLTIHKPLARLTPEDASYVVRALHAHIEEKGLDLCGNLEKRRPRTVILSASGDTGVQEAHNVLSVHSVDGIKLLYEDPGAFPDTTLAM